MRTFIQLRDGIGFATIVTPTDAPDHSVTPEHTTIVEVFTDNPDQFLKKAYNQETASWSDAPIIVWAQVNENGVMVEIGRTYFQHEVPSDALTVPHGVDSSYKWIDGEWVAPVIHVESIVVEPESQTMIDSPQINEEKNVEEATE
jgi:hypothetical protein